MKAKKKPLDMTTLAELGVESRPTRERSEIRAAAGAFARDYGQERGGAARGDEAAGSDLNAQVLIVAEHATAA